MTEKKPIRIGHRGAPSHFWENTLQSIHKAVEIGVDMVEFDIRRTLDNHFVLFHNPSLRKIPFFSKRVRDKRLDEVRSHLVGPGLRIPLLQEAIDAVKGRAHMNIDLKEPGGEEDLVDVLRRKGVAHQVLVSSYFARSLKRIKELDPAIRTGLSVPKERFGVGRCRDGSLLHRPFLWLLRSILPFWATRKVRNTETDAIMVYYRLLTPNLVRRMESLGKQVFAYTVDDPKSIERILEMGVHGIASNRPELLVDPAA